MKNSRHIQTLILGLALLGSVAATAVEAQTRIAVLDFELNDIAGISPTPQQELDRTASLAPLLRDALAKQGYQVIPISAAEQKQANHGFGYLFDHSDEAAKLARQFGAEVVVVGLIHKPSYLFAYLKVHLTDANTGKPLAERYVEIKGSADKVTVKGIANLADQIVDTVKHRSPSAP